MNVFRSLALALLTTLPTAELLSAAEPTVTRDIEFARVGEQRLALDLYRPRNVDAPPLVVWVHGGAWRRGSRASVPVVDLTARGFAVASIDYRLSPVARFPAQAHDIKAAIRFLRAESDELGVNADRVAIAGASAGGHLAALVGVTNEHRGLEGEVGQHGETASDVHAIVSFYGASNLQTILSQSTPHGLSVRTPALDLLLGGSPEDEPQHARLASPVAHVDKHDPPLLLIHGDQDVQMPINQSHELVGAYQQVGRPVRFDVVYGGGHGGEEFYTFDRLDAVAAFLKTHLRSQPPR